MGLFSVYILDADLCLEYSPVRSFKKLKFRFAINKCSFLHVFNVVLRLTFEEKLTSTENMRSTTDKY